MRGLKWAFAAILLALALLAAACGSGGDSDETAGAPDSSVPAGEVAEPEEEAAPEQEAPPEEQDAPEQEDAPVEQGSEASGDDSTEGDSAEATPSPAPAPLTASFRGVTETSIKVGVAVPDFDALQAAGISNYQGDHELAYQAFFDKINAEGGIYGRQIEGVYATFNFLLPVSQEEACLKLTEDEEVFIVLYGLLRDANLCFPDLHDTMLMTASWMTSDLQEQAGETLWLQTEAIAESATAIMAQVLTESGRLDGKTIAIVGNTANTPEQLEALQAVLADLGFDAQTVMLTAPLSDRVATDNEVQILAERFDADGVDFIFDIIGGNGIIQTMAEEGYTPEWAHTNLAAVVDGTEDRSYVDGTVSVSQIPAQAIFEDADFQERCMSVFREAYPELEPETTYLPNGDQQAAGEPNWVTPVHRACNHTRLLKALGEIAGADLTNDTFRLALDELGPFKLIGQGQATFSSDSKWDGLDEFYLQVYDFETDSILIEDDPIIIDRG